MNSTPESIHSKDLSYHLMCFPHLLWAGGTRMDALGRTFVRASTEDRGSGPKGQKCRNTEGRLASHWKKRVRVCSRKSSSCFYFHVNYSDVLAVLSAICFVKYIRNSMWLFLGLLCNILIHENISLNAIAHVITLLNLKHTLINIAQNSDLIN